MRSRTQPSQTPHDWPHGLRATARTQRAVSTIKLKKKTQHGYNMDKGGTHKPHIVRVAPHTVWHRQPCSTARPSALPTVWPHPPKCFLAHRAPSTPQRHKTTGPSTSTHLEHGSLNPSTPNTRTKNHQSVEHTEANGGRNFEICNYKIHVLLQRPPRSKEKQGCTTP